MRHRDGTPDRERRPHGPVAALGEVERHHGLAVTGRERVRSTEDERHEDGEQAGEQAVLTEERRGPGREPAAAGGRGAVVRRAREHAGRPARRHEERGRRDVQRGLQQVLGVGRQPVAGALARHVRGGQGHLVADGGDLAPPHRPGRRGVLEGDLAGADVRCSRVVAGDPRDRQTALAVTERRGRALQRQAYGGAVRPQLEPAAGRGALAPGQGRAGRRSRRPS